MPVIARNFDLQQMLYAGHAITISLLPNIETGKLKFKCLIKPASEQISPLILTSTWHYLELIKNLACGCCHVDRGHLHTDGTREVCILLSGYKKASTWQAGRH